MSAPAVLLVDCPPALDPLLRRALTDHDLLAADRAQLAPEVVLLWLDAFAPDAAARLTDLCDRYRRSAPAIIGLTPIADEPTLAWAAAVGLDDLTATRDAGEIAARAALVSRSRTRFAQANPLTGLPGVGALEREISRRLPQRGEMALLAFDVDHFKSYNDIYGYQRGDGLLRAAWMALEQALNLAPGSFLAHLGGDDFFALVRPAEAEAVGRRAIELFAAACAEHYDPTDLARGEIVVRDRTGARVRTPLASLTVAAVTNEADDLQHSGQLAAVLAELKAYGKRLGGGQFVADRRRVHDGEAAWARREQRDRDASTKPGEGS